MTTQQLEEIGLAVYKERERQRLGIYQCAEKAGVSRWVLEHVERGQSVQTHRLIAVLDAFGLSLCLRRDEKSANNAEKSAHKSEPSISNGLKGDH
jgi:predicted transcriptional regulator